MPTEPTMPVSSLRTELLKWVVAALLAALLMGAAAMAYWLPVQGYSITCAKAVLISCELQRDTWSNQRTWQVALGSEAIATVKVQPRRRGTARVFLYLNSSSQAVFAAEFEDDAAVAQAEAAAAAAELNRVFSSAVPASVRVVAHPPAYFTWLIWGGITFLGMLVLVIYRALFNPKRRPDDASIRA